MPVTATKGANEIVVRALKDWKAMEPGGFLCLSVKHLLFHFHKHVDPSDISTLSSLDSWHAFHPEQGKIKVELCWACNCCVTQNCTNRSGAFQTVTAAACCLSFPPPQTPEFTPVRTGSSFTLSPFDGLAVRPLSPLPYILAVQ